MGIPGLILFLLVWASLEPAFPAPTQPVCDQSVMNKFIQDASKMEKDIVDLCEDACNLPEHVTVSDTRVNFPDWRAMDRSRQASEVWWGQALLSSAVSQVKSQQPRMQPFLRQLEVMESGLRSVREILRRHNAQAGPQEEPLPRTLSVQTVQKLFSVYSSFLRGKVNLFIASICQGSGSKMARGDDVQLREVKESRNGVWGLPKPTFASSIHAKKKKPGLKNGGGLLGVSVDGV